MEESISDEKLAQNSLTNSEYFNIIVDRYTEKIRRYVARLTGNWNESEDVTQEVFIKAYTNIASFDTKMKFSSWLYRIAHNESVNFIKKNYRFKKVEFNDEIKNKFSEDNLAISKIIEDENSELVKGAIYQLKPKHREIIELYYFEEKSYLEIADILQISINSVGPTIKRAKNKLKQIISKNDKFKR